MEPVLRNVTVAVLSILLGNILIPYDGHTISLHGFVYKIILQPLLGDYPGSLAFAILFVGLNWCIGYILYKKKIYIKI